MDIRRAALIIVHWWPILLVGTLLGAGVAYAVGKGHPQVYQASASIQVVPGIGTAYKGNDFDEMQTAWSLAAQDALLVRSPAVADDALIGLRGHLHIPIDGATLLADSAATSISQSTLITVQVHSTDAQDAALLATAMARSFVRQDATARAVGARSSLDSINRQISTYTRDAAAATGPTKGIRLARDQGRIFQLEDEAVSIALSRDGMGAHLRVGAEAAVPMAPTGSRRGINTLIGGLIAFLVLLGLAFLIDYLDPRPRTAHDVAAALDIPLLATLSSSSSGGSSGSVLTDGRSATADDYRRLRSILGLNDDAQGHVVGLIGARAGDGTTTVALHLAAAFARADRRVVLVDAHFRRPTVHRLAGLAESNGLATALLSSAPLPFDVARPARISGVDVVTAGTQASEALDLLGSRRMSEWLDGLHDRYEVVVIDGGTALEPESQAIARLCDEVVVVSRIRGTTRSLLTRTAERLRRPETAAAAAHPAPGRLRGVVVPLFRGTAGPGVTQGDAARSEDSAAEATV